MTVLASLGAMSTAHAETVKHTPHAKAAKHAAHARSELGELRSQLAAQQAEIASQHAMMAQMQAQMSAQQGVIQQTQAQSGAVAEQLENAQAQNADATAAVLASIPTTVNAAVEAAKPKTDAFYYKGLKITPGGFLEQASIYRSRDLASDIASPFNSTPFANTKSGHDDELKQSEHQSRLSFLAQGDVDRSTTLSMYGEFDFQGAPQSANYNESDSWTPRVRHFYGTADWNDTGWHLLAGQTFSLATLDSKGITPRNEVTPPQIDAQYLVGFVWTRQPGVRLTKDFDDHKLWLSVAVENAQTTFTGTVPANVTSLIANGAGIYAGPAGSSTPVAAGGSALTISDPSQTVTTTGGKTTTTAQTLTESGVPTTATQSLNHLPDLIVKAAYELPFQGKSIHTEVFGLGRAFTDQIGTSENTVYGGGVGFGVIVPVLPSLLDVQASGLTGKGIGRYGSSGLPDVTFRPDGRIEPIEETDFLVGGTLHATKMLDIYGFAGEEHENRQAYPGGYGYGAPTINVAGCFTEGGSCSAATSYLEELTAGFWQKIYQGPFGRAQFGVQYSYLERHAFSGVDGKGSAAPIGNESMLFTSFRYYPF